MAREINKLVWREAARAYDRAPHAPIEMQSSDSLSPLKSWFCPICCNSGGQHYAYSTTTEAPVCNGARDRYV